MFMLSAPASWAVTLLPGVHYTVTLQDREQKYIDPALERAAKLFAKRIRDDNDRAAATARLQADVDGAGAAQADLVIEAIFENLEAKQALYADLQSKMQPQALLATNTSSIRLEDLRCADTSQEALDIGFGFVKGIGKLPLECLSAPGFVVNRILAPYMAEAMELAESGVPLDVIDRAAEAFGMPMGPVELVDSVGIDVALHVSKVLGGAMNRPVPEKLAEMVEAGQLGRKSGQGFYSWENGKVVKPQRVVGRNRRNRGSTCTINGQ